MIGPEKLIVEFPVPIHKEALARAILDYRNKLGGRMLSCHAQPDDVDVGFGVAYHAGCRIEFGSVDADTLAAAGALAQIAKFGTELPP